MSESKENLGHRLKISSIGYIKSSHSISLQILPHFDVKNIFVAQKMAKQHHFKNSLENLSIENFSKSSKKMPQRRDNAGAVCNSGMGMLFLCIYVFYIISLRGVMNFFSCIIHDA